MKRKPAYNQPAIDFHDVQSAWFTHRGKSYSVAEAPDAIFKAAVLKKSPHWAYHAGYKELLSKSTFDLIDRWYLLNCLADKDKGIELHMQERVLSKSV